MHPAVRRGVILEDQALAKELVDGPAEIPFVYGKELPYLARIRGRVMGDLEEDPRLGQRIGAAQDVPFKHAEHARIESVEAAYLADLRFAAHGGRIPYLLAFNKYSREKRLHPVGPCAAMSLKYPLLGLLRSEPMNGYAIKTLFDEAINFVWQANLSQIYRELGIVEKEGLVSSSIEQQSDRPDARDERGLSRAGQHRGAPPERPAHGPRGPCVPRGRAEIVPLARYRQTPARPGTDRVGIVFPIIAWGPPRTVKEFVANLDLSGVRVCPRGNVSRATGTTTGHRSEFLRQIKAIGRRLTPPPSALRLSASAPRAP